MPSPNRERRPIPWQRFKLAKEKGAFVFGVCNVVGSTISRVTDAGAYTHAGPEIGVASTKAFTTQITVLSLLALRIAKAKGIVSIKQYKEIINELELIPQKIEIALLANQRILEIAHTYKTKHNCLYLGRGVNFPVASGRRSKTKRDFLYPCGGLSSRRDEAWPHCPYRRKHAGDCGGY